MSRLTPFAFRFDRQAAKQVLSGYGSWVEDHIADGYTAYLTTFMFDRLPAATQAGRMAGMLDAVEIVYARLIQWFASHPNRPSQRRYLPHLICSPDLPVFKRDRMALADVQSNDGLHVHGMLMTPPVSRFKFELVSWINDNPGRLIHGAPIRRLHIVEVDRTPGYAAEYALKASGTRIDADTLLILPKALSERSDKTAKGYDEAVRTVQGASLMRSGRRPI